MSSHLGHKKEGLTRRLMVFWKARWVVSLCSVSLKGKNEHNTWTCESEEDDPHFYFFLYLNYLFVYFFCVYVSIMYLSVCVCVCAFEIMSVYGVFVCGICVYIVHMRTYA